jgi:LacI family transcriptional regulator, galactose operon repressor
MLRPSSRSSRTSRARALPGRHVNLKMLAAHLGLAPATVSLVINHSPAADSIPRRTQERILAAARKFDYRPNYLARSLRAQRTYTIGVLVPEISEGYAALVLSGIEDYLLQEGYIYFVASHRHKSDLVAEYPQLLLRRAVEGLIAVDTPLHDHFSRPTVTVSGHHKVQGVTNIVLNHQRAAFLALDHLKRLGHRTIAFIRGQSFSSDTRVRWASFRQAAQRMSLPIHPRLVVQLEGDLTSPQLGYGVTQKLLAARQPFTALVAFNDISAIGAIRALREAGRRVPEEVSVVGFDDVQSAAFQNPALTTVRQPLRKMGELAAQILLHRIAGGARAPYPKAVVVEPQLVVRESTCRVSPGLSLPEDLSSCLPEELAAKS